MDVIQDGGPGFVLAIVVGIIGLAFSLGAIVVAALSKGWIVPMAAAVVVVLVAMCAGGTGVVSYANKMSKVDNAISNIDPMYRDLLVKQGNYEASLPLIAGIGASLLPGITGLACALIAIKRRSQPVLD